MTGQPRILGDWGSTRLRLWLIDRGAVIDRRYGPGIVGLSVTAADALNASIGDWLDRPVPPVHVTLVGMAGARGGLCEVGYAPCPLSPAAWRQKAADFALDALSVRIGAGCATISSGSIRPDVMRGEEAQSFGAIALQPALGKGRQTLVLPGTHSKWVTLEDGRITGIRTFLTGELFALLGRSSLLPGGILTDEAEEAAGFTEGTEQARQGQGLQGLLFSVRVEQVLRGRSAAWASGYLSGLLIASEASEATATGALPASACLIGDPALTRRYSEAFAGFGIVTSSLDGEACVLEGLRLLDADH